MGSFQADNFICPSTLLKFYLRHGATVTIDWAIHYVPSRALEEFIDYQTAARIRADINEEPQKSKLAKDICNSFYGRNGAE